MADRRNAPVGRSASSAHGVDDELEERLHRRPRFDALISDDHDGDDGLVMSGPDRARPICLPNHQRQEEKSNAQ